MGLLIEGFDTPPSMMMGHALPYYAQRLEEQGFAKAKDVIAYDYRRHGRNAAHPEGRPMTRRSPTRT